MKTVLWISVYLSLFVDTAVAEEPIAVAGIIRDPVALNEAHDVELQGDLAFVAGKGNAIAMVDVREPTKPKLVWHRNDPDLIPDSETVLLDDGRLFLGSRHFHSIDITNRASPIFDASLIDDDKINTINGMVRRGDFILASNKKGMVNAFDISDPASPQLVGLVRMDERFKIPYPHDIDLYREYAVIVDPNGFGTHPGNLILLRVFNERGDLLPDSEWESAGRVSSETLNGANRVQVHGDHAFVGGSYFPKISQGRALATGSVFDLSNPARPREIATTTFPDPRGPNGLTVVGHIWFLAGGQTIQAYDIRDPATPRLLASLQSEVAFPTADDNAHDLVYRNGYLYVTSQGDHGLVIFKVNDEKIRELAKNIISEKSTSQVDVPHQRDSHEIAPPTGQTLFAATGVDQRRQRLLMDQKQSLQPLESVTILDVLRNRIPCRHHSFQAVPSTYRRHLAAAVSATFLAAARCRRYVLPMFSMPSVLDTQCRDV